MFKRKNSSRSANNIVLSKKTRLKSCQRLRLSLSVYDGKLIECRGGKIVEEVQKMMKKPQKLGYWANFDVQRRGPEPPICCGYCSVEVCRPLSSSDT
uniref:Uncharacterized protein n=1 Tax=Romanomermis culicivorax TaxID=13658 RepID=A0A915HNG8_ROMCU